MNKKMYNSNIWEQLFQFSNQYPINWSGYEKQFEIRKLELEKLENKQIREKKLDFEKKYMAEHQISKSWMENQYRLFIWFLFTYSKLLSTPPQHFGPLQWNVVADCFSKEPLFCQYFYLSSKKIKSLEWTAQEDGFIQKMMKTSLGKKWTEIGLELYIKSGGLFFRRPKSIRERWLSHLNPEIKKDEWDIEQDLKLIQNIKQKGRRWSQIAKVFGNRTEHTIKNRYNQLLTKYAKDDTSLKFESVAETDNYKIGIIKAQLQKAERKQTNLKSTLTLPENDQPVNHCQVPIKVEEQEDLQKQIKHFNPIILAMPVDPEFYRICLTKHSAFL